MSNQQTLTSVPNKPLFLRALHGENTQRAPVWIMRQAGRYLPEYRALKEKYSFWELCRTPELATEVTLQPLKRFALDAAIVFSDIMTPLSDMGVTIDFRPGPVLEQPVRTAAQVDALRTPESEAIAPFVAQAIRLLRSELKVPLIGFAGAPLTLATYLVQGQGSKDYPLFRQFLYAQPERAHQLLQKLTTVTIRYLQSQIEAGAQAIQLFDSWAGLHDQKHYQTFGFPYAKAVFDALQSKVTPCLYIAVGAGHLLPSMAALPVHALSVDWRQPLSRVRPLAQGKALQGNLDPAALLAPPEQLKQLIRQVLQEGLGGPHIFNLGHGIFPQTQPEQMQRLVDTVHRFDRSQALDVIPQL